MRKLKKKDIVLIIAGIIFLLLLAFIGIRILPKNRWVSFPHRQVFRGIGFAQLRLRKVNRTWRFLLL